MNLINEKRTFNTVRLTDNQKKVMTKIIAAPTDDVASAEISKGRKMITARDILVRLGLISYNADDDFVALTPTGEQLLKDYNLIDEMGALTDEGSRYAYDGQEQQAMSLTPPTPAEDLGFDDENPFESMHKTINKLLKESS